MKTEQLSEATIDADPFRQFSIWYARHLENGDAIPDSVSLGTSPRSGRVSVRTVLLKGYDSRGFVFFTNYNSRKAVHLSENPFAALHFHWQESGRQVRIEGITEKVPDTESEAYFATRPRESQLSAWASEQSASIPGRPYLEKRYESFDNHFAGKPVGKPPHWGGYRLIPDLFEFWQDGEFRLHDRIQYTLTSGKWVKQRLAP